MYTCLCFLLQIHHIYSLYFLVRIYNIYVVIIFKLILQHNLNLNTQFQLELKIENNIT